MLKVVICILIKGKNTFKVDETNPHKLLLWKSTGVSNENFEPPEDKNTPLLLFDKIWPYLKIESFKFLAQKKKKISYTHDKIVNIYIAYLMPDITHAKESDFMRFGLFGLVQQIMIVRMI